MDQVNDNNNERAIALQMMDSNARDSARATAADDLLIARGMRAIGKAPLLHEQASVAATREDAIYDTAAGVIALGSCPSCGGAGGWDEGFGREDCFMCNCSGQVPALPFIGMVPGLEMAGLDGYDIHGADWDLQVNAQKSYTDYFDNSGKLEEVYEMTTVVSAYLTGKGADERNCYNLLLERGMQSVTMCGGMLHVYNKRIGLFVLADIEQLEQVYNKVISL